MLILSRLGGLIIYRRLIPAVAVVTLASLVTYTYTQLWRPSHRHALERTVVVPARRRDLDSEATLEGVIGRKGGSGGASYFVQTDRSGNVLVSRHESVELV